MFLFQNVIKICIIGTFQKVTTYVLKNGIRIRYVIRFEVYTRNTITNVYSIIMYTPILYNVVFYILIFPQNNTLILIY